MLKFSSCNNETRIVVCTSDLSGFLRHYERLHVVSRDGGSRQRRFSSNVGISRYSPLLSIPGAPFTVAHSFAF